MTKSRSFLLAVALASACSASAALIPVVSYGYDVAPDSGYPDATGFELNDGVTHSLAWGGVPIVLADVDGLVGWLYSTPTITFNFGAPVTIRSFTAWTADSDFAAGVAVPLSLDLSTLGFSQTFLISDPDGSGTTVALSGGGFEVTTSSITLTATPSAPWTMFSEVQFFDSVIPEPSTYAAVAGIAALGLAAFRRRRS